MHNILNIIYDYSFTSIQYLLRLDVAKKVDTTVDVTKYIDCIFNHKLSMSILNRFYNNAMINYAFVCAFQTDDNMYKNTMIDCLCHKSNIKLNTALLQQIACLAAKTGHLRTVMVLCNMSIIKRDDLLENALLNHNNRNGNSIKILDYVCNRYYNNDGKNIKCVNCIANITEWYNKDNMLWFINKLGNTHCIELFYEMSIIYNNLQLIKDLINNKILVNTYYSYVYVGMAIIHNRFDIFTLIIDNGFKVNDYIFGQAIYYKKSKFLHYITFKGYKLKNINGIFNQYHASHHDKIHIITYIKWLYDNNNLPFDINGFKLQLRHWNIKSELLAWYYSIFKKQIDNYYMALPYNNSNVEYYNDFYQFKKSLESNMCLIQ